VSLLDFYRLVSYGDTITLMGKKVMGEIITYSPEESQVLEDCIRILRLADSPLAEVVVSRSHDLQALAQIVSRTPSPVRDLFNSSSQRNLESLTEKMVNQGFDQVVNLPVKAVLGHGFTVSKLHLFGLLGKLTISEPLLADYRYEVENLYNDILFTLMAEDLYSSILSNSTESDPWVHRAAKELVDMWDFRTSSEKETFAPYIRDLWRARHTLVPVLGTLMGTMELMRLSSSLPHVWLAYLQLPDEDLSMNYALEEFLFDLSYEQISTLRSYMNSHKIASVDRTMAVSILKSLNPNAIIDNDNQKDRFSGMLLYHSFLKRQRNARNRRCASQNGPAKTLEEYFVTYLLTIEP